MRSAITSFVLPAVRSISTHMLAGQQQPTQPQHMLSLVHLGQLWSNLLERNWKIYEGERDKYIEMWLQGSEKHEGHTILQNYCPAVCCAMKSFPMSLLCLANIDSAFVKLLSWDRKVTDLLGIGVLPFCFVLWIYSIFLTF